MAAPLTIPTSIGQTVGAVQNIASTVTAAGINVNGIASMSQAATNLTAAGANLLKLNQQATSAIKGLLPNSTLTVDAALSKVKVGLENTFSAQGAAATATDFFKAAKETADKIASDVKAVAEKIASGIDPTSLAKSATGGLSSLTNVVGSVTSSVSSAVSSVTSAVSSVAQSVSSYIPGAGAALAQTGSISATASAAVTNTINSLKQAGAAVGVNTAQIAAANQQLTGAVSSLSQALKISAPGVALPGGLPAIPSIPAIPGLPGGIPAIDPAKLKAATAAIEAAQNPPNPLATAGTKIGAIDRSKLDSAFLSALPPGLPSFDPGTISAAQQAGAAINTARFKNTKDEDLTYTGPDTQVWDDINNERLKRGLSGLPNPRPAEDSEYAKKYSNPAYSGG